MTRAAPGARSALSYVGAAAAAVVAGCASAFVGWLYVLHNRLAMLTLGGLAIAVITAVSPMAIPVAAFPAIWVPGQRVAGVLSVGDAVLALAAVMALFSLSQGSSRAARPVYAVMAILLATDAVAVAAHPTRVGAQELVHRLIIVGGAVAVGSWVARQGHLASALRALLLVSSAFAVVACADRLRTGAAAFPLGYHKNFAGAAFGTVVLLLLASPQSFDLHARPRLRWGALMLLLAGLIATSSRGAILGVALAGTLWLLRSSDGHRRVNAPLTVVLVLGLSYLGATSVQQQLTDHSNGATTIDSLTQRQAVERQTRDLWRTSPLVGVGVRFFRASGYETYEPPNNMFDESLAEAGLLGTFGLAVFVVGSIVLTFRMRHPLGQGANMVLVTAFFHGQVDIFWANGQALNWLVVGAALGTVAASADQAGKGVEHRTALWWGDRAHRLRRVG